VNYYTTLVCHTDVQKMKAAAPGKVARFTGLGGEFIRHPFKNLSLFPSREADVLLYSGVPARDVERAIGLPRGECRRFLRQDLAGYPETSRSDKIRRLYYFYYGRYVGHAGGERERGTFWCVSPLWSASFARTVFSKVPLKWIGFEYFTEFMKELDARLAAVPLYGSAIDFASPVSVRRHHRRYYMTRNNSFVKKGLRSGSIDSCTGERAIPREMIPFSRSIGKTARVSRRCCLLRFGSSISKRPLTGASP
jgi:hypothetical protein